MMGQNYNYNLYTAVGCTNFKVVRELLLEGADPNCRDVMNGTTPLHASIEKCNLDIAKLLVASGANVNDCDNNVGSSPLGVAALVGNVEMIKFLICHGARLSKGESGIVEEATNLGLNEVASLLSTLADD